MITLELSGVRFTNFLSINVERSIENVYGTFNFRATFAKELGFPIKRRQPCRVLVNETPIITGFVEVIDIQYGADSHTVTIRGADATVDVFKSQLDSDIEFVPPISLEAIIRQTLAKINITKMKVINEAGLLDDFQQSDLVSGRVGETAFAFIENYARKRQVFITTDGLGNIVLARGSSQRNILGGLYNIVGDPAQRNNILSSSTVFDDSERFYKYKAISQLNPTSLNDMFSVEDESFDIGGDGSKNVVESSAETTDASIRNTRMLVFNSESSSSSEELKKRVNWEINIRRVRSAVYKATVQGDTYDGINPWRVNRLVQVIDNFASINASLLIKSVAFELSLEGGTKTTLELVVADGYSPEPFQSQAKENVNPIGIDFEALDQELAAESINNQQANNG